MRAINAGPPLARFLVPSGVFIGAPMERLPWRLIRTRTRTRGGVGLRRPRTFAVVRARSTGRRTNIRSSIATFIHELHCRLLAFNVYLESPTRLGDYLARLQNIAGDRPLLMAEVGLDSLRHGEPKQALVLQWQVHTAFAEGAAGLFIFSWTDEWYRGGQEILDWKFGLTTRDRRPKLALNAIVEAFRAAPLSNPTAWPMASVVICSYNGAKTLRECLTAVTRLEYPDFEVIVVNDGSSDATPRIAAEFDVKVISIPNGGLSNARNVGWRNARGEIVAYVDDDACPDPHWLAYIVSGLLRSDFAGIGGPNLSPAEDCFVAHCVDCAPGNPTHVLIDDRRAEHVPGCNMAFWRHRIEAVDGFDATFRIAGDDVDFCWRLQAKGWTLGFTAPAVVWHHRRNTVRTYWRATNASTVRPAARMRLRSVPGAISRWPEPRVSPSFHPSPE